MPATPKQTALFSELLVRKQFPDNTDTAQLSEQFAALNRATASDWIDRALALPNLPEDADGVNTPAPF